MSESDNEVSNIRVLVLLDSDIEVCIIRGLVLLGFLKIVSVIRVVWIINTCKGYKRLEMQSLFWLRALLVFYINY